MLRETAEGERRVALVPGGVGKLTGLGLDVQVEAGAGVNAKSADKAYQDAGATVAKDRKSALAKAGVVLKVQPPTTDEIKALPAGAVTISFLQPAAQAAQVEALAKAGITSFSLDLVPRISRAQSMDALSSQAGVAGYQAVLVAASRLPKFFPMLMTAAGTIAPARVLVMGAGVAGLQAIATSRRLGAVVEAYDVRPAVKDEVKSLGAKFLELPLDVAEAQGTGGYAREQSEEFLAKQRELIGSAVAESDVVITTAAVPGRKAPVLVTADMVHRMRPGSVVVDLAAETGGNCELTQPGKEIEVGEVVIYGVTNLPSGMAVHASQLYSRNVVSLLELMIDKKGELNLDLEDEIIKGACVTHGGEIVNERARQMTGAAR